MSLWVALDDATEQNGAMIFAPGTHHTADYERNCGIGQNLGELFGLYPEWNGVHPKIVPMKAGSASFHNGMLAHGAGANMTPGRRRAMTCGYMPVGSVFNGKQNVLPADYMATLEIGQLLDNNDLNPLIWPPGAPAPHYPKQVNARGFAKL